MTSRRRKQIAAALSRAQPKTFAAADDPHRYERQVRAEQATHQAHLRRRPSDVSDKISRAEQVITARERDLHDAHARLAHWQDQYRNTAGVRGLSPRRRQEHHHATRKIEFQQGVIQSEQQRLETAQLERRQLLQHRAAGIAFDQANDWRHKRLDALQTQLRNYWAEAVLGAARDGHPATYGKDRLLTARKTIIERIETLSKDPTPNSPQQVSDGLGDPLKALGDLDRAIKQASEQPTPRLVEPPKPRWSSDRLSARMQHEHLIHEQHRAFEQLYHSPPSAGIEM